MSRRLAVFLRHGDYFQRPNAPSAHQPFPLTDNGKVQAHGASLLLAAMAKGQGCAIHPVIHASNLLRAWQTADIIRQDLGGIDHVQGHNELAERGVGIANNLNVAEIEAVLQRDPRYDSPPEGWKSDSHYRLPFPGAESLMEAGQRVAAHVRGAMSALAESDRDTMMVFVGHGAAFRHAAHILGVLAFEDVAKLSMHHATPVALEDRGDEPWAHVAGEWKVRGEQEETLD